jgi:hypothetical protein
MNHTGVWLTGSRRQAARKELLTPRRLVASHVLSARCATVTDVTERLCKDCDGLLVEAPASDDSDLDLMCVLCGAALTLGGMLLGELEALEDERLAG